MRTIQIDDDVFEALRRRAIPYEERAPNDTLRRLLGVSGAPIRTPNTTTSTRSAAPRTTGGHRVMSKAPKARLEDLVAAGLLKEGQTLYLHGYNGQRIPGETATISGSRLRKDGREVAMSPLAKERLKAHGYRSDSVRGPNHWYTESRESIRDLWGLFLAAN